MFHAEDDTQDVGIEGRRVGLGGLFGDRPRLAFCAGIVYGDVEPAESRDGLVDEVAHVILVTHVSADEFGLGAEIAQFRGEFIAGVLASAGDNDSRPVTGERDGGGAANSGQCAGDQDTCCM